ncbi:protein of unknown function [Clostridium beijerinckii]|nr:protein of unknown function [Clostridium beijerinckii]
MFYKTKLILFLFYMFCINKLKTQISEMFNYYVELRNLIVYI